MFMEYIGNKELLNLPKTAFLASSTIPTDMVLKCYDWATGKHEGCVVSGFSSKLEKDVLHFLLKNNCHVILVLARQIYKKIPQELQSLIDKKQLLIVSTSSASRQSKATAQIRNRYICEMSDRIILIVATENSSLFDLQQKYSEKLYNL